MEKASGKEDTRQKCIVGALTIFIQLVMLCYITWLFATNQQQYLSLVYLLIYI